MANIEARLKVKIIGALMLDPDGFIAEGSGNNFYYQKNKVISPEGRNMLKFQDLMLWKSL